MTTEKVEQVSTKKAEPKPEVPPGDSATDSDGEDSAPELLETDSKQDQSPVGIFY